jgi:hypothetical protein
MLIRKPSSVSLRSVAPAVAKTKNNKAKVKLALVTADYVTSPRNFATGGSERAHRRSRR